MLNNNKFYHSTIRNAITAFGSLFNNIQIDRKDAESNTVQTIKVPLIYGSKSKALARVRSQPDLEDRPFHMLMPIISFEISGFEHNPSRKLPQLNQSRAPFSETSAKTQYTSAPYDMNIIMTIIVKNQEDGLQIVEQILPYFNPVYTVTMNDIPDLGIQRDLPIAITGVNYTDEYEGPVEKTSTITWQLSFNLKLNFYGPISTSNVIKTATVNTHISSDTTVKSGQQYVVSVNPLTADVDDEWDFLESFNTLYE